MPAIPELSVVIPTYNRAPELRRALLRLTDQSPTLEIIVVDNASTDETPAVVDELTRTVPGLRYMHERRRGPSAARNTGAAAAKADIIAFLDDDVTATTLMGRRRSTHVPRASTYLVRDRPDSARVAEPATDLADTRALVRRRAHGFR